MCPFVRCVFLLKGPHIAGASVYPICFCFSLVERPAGHGQKRLRPVHTFGGSSGQFHVGQVQGTV